MKLQGALRSSSSRAACRPARRIVCLASLNGKALIKPSPAETARTIVSIVGEGTLSTLSADGTPVGTPVSYTLDKEGHAWVSLPKDAPEAKHLKSNGRCSLMVQPQTLPGETMREGSVGRAREEGGSPLMVQPQTLPGGTGGATWGACSQVRGGRDGAAWDA